VVTWIVPYLPVGGVDEAEARYDVAMGRDAKAVLTEALTLSEDERADIAGALLNSLEPETDSDIEAAWREEVATRVAALDAGEVETISWENIRDRLVTRLSERRAG
jgi:putative addiction module component (TIGR02574 family)